MKDYSLLSNAEIRIQLQELEFKYEAVKNKMKENLATMKELNSEYLMAKELLSKRTKGRL